MIAVSMVCSILFVMTVTVVTVVWIRVQHDRLPLAIMAQASQGRHPQDPESANIDTKEPRQELSTLPSYGRHPYNLPNKWTPSGFRESVQQPLMAESMIHPQGKGRSRSLQGTLPRSQSKHHSIVRQKPIPLGSLAALADSLEQISRTKEEPVSKGKEPTSAVEGVSELPAEKTPRTTPEGKKEDGMNSDPDGRQMSAAWPLPAQKNRSSETATPGSQSGLLEATRVCTRSITTQTAGTAPQQPMPPPPASCRPIRYLPKDDSVMQLSFMSLETVDSSILDDGTKTPTSGDVGFNSPALPPCPTFNPFSPYLRGTGDGHGARYAAERESPSQKQPVVAQFSLAVLDSRKIGDARSSPRGSLTSRQTTYSIEQSSQTPRRSGSVESSPRRQASPMRGKAQTTTTVPCQHLHSLRPNSANPRHSFNQQSHSLDERQVLRLQDADRTSILPQRRTMDENQRIIDPAILKAIHNHKETAEETRASLAVNRSPSHAGDSPSRAQSPSALKGAQGMRKGHRRQSSVRTSIHPSLSFGGPAFSPTIEEPEDSHELEERYGPGPTSRPGPLMLTSPRRSPRRHRHSRHLSEETILGDGRGLASSPGTISRIRSNVARKGLHTRLNSAGDVFKSESDKTAFDILKSPPSEEGSLSRTPSPERPVSLLAIPYDPASTQLHSNSPTTSPRPSAVKGPHSQPPKPSRNSVVTPAAATTDAPTSAPSGKDPCKSVLALRRTNSGVRDLSSLTVYRNMGTRNTSSENPTIATLATRKSSGMRSGTINVWEDASVSASPMTLASTRAHSGEPSGPSSDAFNRRSVDSLSNGDDDADDDDDDSKNDRASEDSDKTLKQGMMTPKGKAIGLGIGCPTPASLHDRDGFEGVGITT